MSKIKDIQVIKIKTFIKKIKNMFKKHKTLTFFETIQAINKEYIFIRFNKSLISEIYTKLLPYGTVKVINKGAYKYTIKIINDKNDVIRYNITQSGLVHTNKD